MALQIRVLLAAAVAAIGIDAGSARADEVKVLAANAVKEPFLAIAATFEKATGQGHRVVEWHRGHRQADHGRRGSGRRLVGSASFDKLIQEGKLVSGSRASFAKVGVGVAVRAGLPKPDISSAQCQKSSARRQVGRLFVGAERPVHRRTVQAPGHCRAGKDKLKLPPSNVLSRRSAGARRGRSRVSANQ